MTRVRGHSREQEGSEWKVSPEPTPPTARSARAGKWKSAYCSVFFFSVTWRTRQSSGTRIPSRRASSVTVGFDFLHCAALRSRDTGARRGGCRRLGRRRGVFALFLVRCGVCAPGRPRRRAALSPLSLSRLSLSAASSACTNMRCRPMAPISPDFLSLCLPPSLSFSLSPGLHHSAGSLLPLLRRSFALNPSGFTFCSAMSSFVHSSIHTVHIYALPCSALSVSLLSLISPAIKRFRILSFL